MKKLMMFSLAMMLSVSVAAASDEAIRERLTQIDPNMPILSIKPIELESFYAVTLETGELLFVDEKAQFILSGDLYKVDENAGVTNLSETLLSGYRQSVLAEVADADMIIYPAEGEKRTRVRIFTDVDCPYCQRLHEQVPEMNAMGIEVAYLAFPRSGPGQPTAIEMEKIWCQPDEDAQRSAMDDSKAGLDVEGERCDSPVIEQLQVGQRVGVNGTPAMVLEDGSLIPGFVPAARLKQMLGL